MTAQEWDDIAVCERARVWRDRDADRQLAGWWGDLSWLGQGDS